MAAQTGSDANVETNGPNMIAFDLPYMNIYINREVNVKIFIK